MVELVTCTGIECIGMSPLGYTNGPTHVLYYRLMQYSSCCISGKETHKQVSTKKEGVVFHIHAKSIEKERE